MRKALRWRYYCDFCKKAGMSGFHIGRHEASCTMNPDRVCRMCKAFANQQPPMLAMLALLPEMPALEWTSEETDRPVRAAVAEALPRLRALCEGCPVCIFAALRQKGIPVPLADDFNLTAEMKNAWDEKNAAEEESRGYGMGSF